MVAKIFLSFELICFECPSIFVFLSKSSWLITVGKSYFLCFILMNKTQSMGKFVFKQNLNNIQWCILVFLVSFVWCSGFKPVVPHCKSLYGKRRVWPQQWIKSRYLEYLELLCFVQKHRADMRNDSLIYIFGFMYVQNKLKSLSLIKSLINMRFPSFKAKPELRLCIPAGFYSVDSACWTLLSAAWVIHSKCKIWSGA